MVVSTSDVASDTYSNDNEIEVWFSARAGFWEVLGEVSCLWTDG